MFSKPSDYILGFITTVLIGFSSVSHAQKTVLSPFIAHYASTWDVGLKIGGKATRQLQQLADGNWQLSLNAKALVAKLNETSLMTINDQQLSPLDYNYSRKILNRTKQLRVQFDWGNQTATTTTSKSWNMPIQAPLQDKLSVQLQLRKDISQRPSGQFAYQVAAGGQVETFQYQALQQELLDLPIGQLQALKVERLRDSSSDRKTYIWFAPSLDFHVVRIVQVEPGGKRYQLDLQSLEQ